MQPLSMRFFKRREFMQRRFRRHYRNHGTGFQIVHCGGLAWRSWGQAKCPKSVVGAIGIGTKRVFELDVDIQGDGYVVVIFYPMWTVHRNMNTVPGAQLIGGCATLKLWFVRWRIVVDCPESLDFLFGKNFAICAIEDVDCLCPFDLV